MPKYRLGKWRHPKTEALRVYVNGLETTDKKVWFERGERKGTALPPIYGVILNVEGQTVPAPDIVQEVAEAFSEMDLFLDSIDWTRLTKAADW